MNPNHQRNRAVTFLTRTVIPKSSADILGHTFREMSEHLQGVIGEVRTNATDVASASIELASAVRQCADATQRIATGVHRVARGAEQTTASVQETAAAAGQVNCVIDQITEGAKEQATAVASASSAVAEIDGVAGAARRLESLVAQFRLAGRESTTPAVGTPGLGVQTRAHREPDPRGTVAGLWTANSGVQRAR